MTIDQKTKAISYIRSSYFLKKYYSGSQQRVIKYEDANLDYLNYLANSIGYKKWVLKQILK